MDMSAPIQIRSAPKPVEVMLFTRHLATMVKSGIPVAGALSTLSEQTKSPEFKRIIDVIHADVSNGQSLADALRKHPKAFDTFYIHLIEISESSGTLEENLGFIALELAKNYSLKKKIQTAALYPSIIFIAVTVMGGFISLFILPQLVGFFESFEIELPLATRALLFIANAFNDYGILIVGGLLGFYTLMLLVFRLPGTLPVWHTFLLRIPIMGEFIAHTQLAQFCRNFGILIKSGVPIAKSIDVTAATLTNLRFRTDLFKVGKALTRGKNIAEAIEKGGYEEFPPLVSKMIGVGEKTGKLDESLLYLGDFYEEEIDAMSKNLTTILEPILLLGIGLVVGFVAIAIITPIYELTGSIRR